jgi:hypothetical protein
MRAGSPTVVPRDQSVSIAEHLGARMLTLEEAERLSGDRDALERVDVNLRALIEGGGGEMSTNELGRTMWLVDLVVGDAEAQLASAEAIRNSAQGGGC